MKKLQESSGFMTKMKNIDKKSPIPLYYQLYKILKERIKRGEFRIGSYLPSENELAKIYGVSRLTVREALSELVKEGFIEKKRGKGSLIIKPKNVENLTGLHSFTEEAKIAGYNPGSSVLENRLVDAPPMIAEKLGLPSNSKIVLLKRLRLLNGEPYAIEVAYINPMIDLRILNILDMDMSKHSLYKFFRETLGLKLLYADETLEVAKASPDTQKLLMIPKGSCIVLRNRFTYVEGNRCIEYVRSIYRGDRYRFTLRLYSH